MPSNKDNIPTNLWENLPQDILSSIADNFGLIDLLSFRGVCKSWRASSSRATARVESSPGLTPWFLLYRDQSPCLLLGDNYHKSYINIPELEGATCLASNHGWLLLLKKRSVFFFCPFSHSRIDLPELPISQLPDHIAAVSSPPTSEDCIVCVPIRDKDSNRIEIMMISRGEYQWTKHGPRQVATTAKLSNITCATCYSGVFYFWDVGNLILKFCPQEEKWTFCRLVNPGDASPNTPTMPFHRVKMSQDWKEHSKDWLGNSGECGILISACGTTVNEGKYDMLIENEMSNPEQLDSSRLRGVWFQPQFFQVPHNQTW